ncbi:nitric oxide reductase activation protein NorD [Chloroflexota bacterium]
MYSQALAGSKVQIDSCEDSGGWIHPDIPATDGTTIVLPLYVDRYDSEEENFAWYKVAATHQAGHIEFGTFNFSFEKATSLFPGRPRQLLSEDETDLTDIERFFSLFDDRKLSTDIFAVAEDVRIDYLLKQEYAGIRGSYQQIQQESLSRRPPLSSLSLREAFLEILIRIGLDSKLPVLPSILRSSLQSAVQILRRLQSLEATVEDSAEATLRLYKLIGAIPDKLLPAGQRDVTDWNETDWNETEFGTADSTSNEPETELSDQSLGEMELRGDSDTEPFSLEDIKNFVNQEIELGEVLRENYPSYGFYVNDLLAGAQAQEIPADTQEEDIPELRAMLGEIPDKEGVQSFLYDEWDFRTCCYLPEWCRVREVPLPDGDADFFKETLARNSSLATQLRKQFEMLAPQNLKKINRLQDGEEMDLDALIESVVERKAGRTPNDKIYWKRMKVHRDVAVVFLIDMSASTSEVIKDTDEGEDDPDGSADTMEDPSQSRAYRIERLAKRPRRRVIDVARESVVLMINALEIIGDSYGVYGFSSSGRDNVELRVIKELDEPFSHTVESRIDTIRPLFSTRMGPAIRHAISKLETSDAKNKILFLVSDGYPQDRDYGQDSDDKEYALRDTEMAFVEAKRKNIVPFCLTIDAAGYDFLKEMTHDIDHKVILNVESLPRHLPSLYRRLTS